MLAAGKRYKVVDHPETDKEVSTKDATILVRMQKARWVEKRAMKKQKQDRTRPDLVTGKDQDRAEK